MKKFDIEKVIDLMATINELKEVSKTHCENSTDKNMVKNVIDSIEDLLIHIGEMDYPIE